MKKIYCISTYSKEGAELARNSFSSQVLAEKFLKKMNNCNTSMLVRIYTSKLDEEFNEEDFRYL